MRRRIRDLIARREKDLPKTEFEKILKTSVERKDIISLGPGEPDFDSPKNVKEALKRAVDKNLTHYSTTAGTPELREEISKKLRRQNGIEADPDRNIVTTTGSSEGLMLASMIFVEPGDKAVYPNPGYMDYLPLIEMMGGSPVPMNLLNKEGFGAEMERVRKASGKKTHVIIINSPSNPTGKVMKRKELEEVADLANEHGSIIFSDEAYESFLYGDSKHVSPASLNGMEDNVVSLFSFSKTYSMAGYRIGYAVGPDDFVKAMNRLRLYSTISSPAFVQAAAVEAMRSSDGYVEKMRKEYERRGKMMCKRLSEIGTFKCGKPEGAFYMFPDVAGFGMKSTDMSHRILEEAKVLVVSGTEFGENGEGYVRMSYATSYEKVQEAMDRLESWVRKFR